MTRSLVAAALAAAAVVAAGLPSPAADPGREATAADVELLAEAYRVAEFAERAKSPEAYITAGAMILKLKAVTKGAMGTLDAAPEVLDADGRPVAGAKAEARKAESLAGVADGFFESATSLGLATKTSREVEALIKSAKTRDYTAGEEKRGAVGGPKLVARGIGAHETHVYTIAFDTTVPVAVGFQSSAPVQCRMHRGTFVVFDQHVSVGQYYGAVKQGPPVQTYKIAVHNNLKAPVTYRLFTN